MTLLGKIILFICPNLKTMKMKFIITSAVFFATLQMFAQTPAKEKELISQAIGKLKRDQDPESEITRLKVELDEMRAIGSNQR